MTSTCTRDTSPSTRASFSRRSSRLIGIIAGMISAISSALACLGVYFFNAAQMALLAREARHEPRLNGIFRLLLAYEPRAERENIGVIVLAADRHDARVAA